MCVVFLGDEVQSQSSNIVFTMAPLEALDSTTVVELYSSEKG